MDNSYFTVWISGFVAFKYIIFIPPSSNHDNIAFFTDYKLYIWVFLDPISLNVCFHIHYFSSWQGWFLSIIQFCIFITWNDLVRITIIPVWYWIATSSRGVLWIICFHSAWVDYFYFAFICKVNNYINMLIINPTWIMQRPIMMLRTMPD